MPVSCMDARRTLRLRRCSASTHNVWHGLGERIRQFLSSITLADLTEEANARLSERND